MIEELIGKTVCRIGVSEENTIVDFECTDGSEYQMYHDQDCCEFVWLDDVVGDFEDIMTGPILVAEMNTNQEEDPEIKLNEGYIDESYTWTFYTLRTNRGTVTMRWFGTSNGYYSEEVNFVQTKEPKK